MANHKGIVFHIACHIRRICFGTDVAFSPHFFRRKKHSNNSNKLKFHMSDVFATERADIYV